jgi:hypothetical protein
MVNGYQGKGGLVSSMFQCWYIFIFNIVKIEMRESRIFIVHKVLKKEGNRYICTTNNKMNICKKKEKIRNIQDSIL